MKFDTVIIVVINILMTSSTLVLSNWSAMKSLREESGERRTGLSGQDSRVCICFVSVLYS